MAPQLGHQGTQHLINSFQFSPHSDHDPCKNCGPNYEMARGVESSRTRCEIPDEVFAILSGLKTNKPTKPVWSIYKTRKGYGLKLFWKFY